MLKERLIVISALFVMFVGFGLVIHLQNQPSGLETRKLCEQYLVIPEKHLDHIPSGCVPYYFENR